MIVALWGRDQLAEDSGVEDAGGWGGVTLAHNVRSPAEVDAVHRRGRGGGRDDPAPRRRDVLGRLLGRLRRPRRPSVGGRPQPALDARRPTAPITPRPADRMFLSSRQSRCANGHGSEVDRVELRDIEKHKFRSARREQVEQEAVAPDAFRVEPVLAHDPDPLEADLLVAADRALVVGGGVDREPVVAAVVGSGGAPSSGPRPCRARGRGTACRGRGRCRRCGTPRRSPRSTGSSPPPRRRRGSRRPRRPRPRRAPSRARARASARATSARPRDRLRAPRSGRRHLRRAAAARRDPRAVP